MKKYDTSYLYMEHYTDEGVEYKYLDPVFYFARIDEPEKWECSPLDVLRENDCYSVLVTDFAEGRYFRLIEQANYHLSRFLLQVAFDGEAWNYDSEFQDMMDRLLLSVNLIKRGWLRYAHYCEDKGFNYYDYSDLALHFVGINETAREALWMFDLGHCDVVGEWEKHNEYQIGRLVDRICQRVDKEKCDE